MALKLKDVIKKYQEEFINDFDKKINFNAAD